MKEKRKNIVISGCGILSPWGNGIEDIYKLLKNEQTVAEVNDKFQMSSVIGFDAAKKLGKTGLRTMNSATRFSMSAALDCLSDAKIAVSEVGDSTGVVIGSHLGHLDSLSEMMEIVIEEGSVGLSPLNSGNAAVNVMASTVGRMIGAKALNTTIHGSYTAGLDAVQYACQSLLNNHAEYVLAGGAESANTYYIEWLKNNGSMQAFEGAGMVLLEKKDTALMRGVTPLGIISAYSTTPYSGLDSINKSLGLTLKAANLQVEDVDVFLGAGDSLGKRVEEEALFGLGFSGPSFYTREILGEGLAVTGIYQLIAGITLLKNGYRNVLIHLFGKNGNSSAIILSGEEAMS